MRGIALQCAILACTLISSGCHDATPARVAPPAAPPPRESLTEQDSPHNRFSDEVAGFGISKPTTWQFLDTEWERKSRKGVSFGSATADTSHQNGAPQLVIFVKHRNPCSPTVRVRMLPAGDLETKSARDVAVSLATFLRKEVPTSVLRGDVTETKVAGRAAGYFGMLFQVEMVEARRTCDFFSRIWVVPRAHDIFSITMSGPVDEEESLSAEFADILASIAIKG